MKRILVALLFAVACAGEGTSPDDNTWTQPPPSTDPDPEPDPEPEPEPEPEPVDVGTYTLVTEVDVTTSSLLPEMAYQYYDILRRFKEDPASTIVWLLDEAGVPLVRDLFEAMPSYMESKVKEWVNDYVRARVWQDSPVGAQIDTILEYGEMALTHFEIVSELDLTTPTARHRLVAFRFHIAGETIDVAVPATARAPFATDVAVAASLDGQSVTLGDHSFGVELGKLAWVAFNEALNRRYGVTLRERLGQLVDCAALATSISTRCYSGYCVGHEEQLAQICETGLDELEIQMQEKVEEVAYRAVRFSSGTATLVENRLENGVWQAEIDAGQGPRVVPATFTGVSL